MSTVHATESALLRKLDEIARRHEALQQSLGDPAVLANVARLVAITREAGQIEPVVSRYREYQRSRAAVEELREMAGHKADKEMAELAAAELPEAEAKAAAQ